MHKRLWKFWSSVSLWAIALLVVLSAVGSIYGLRHNNQQMVELRQAVFDADKEGDKEAIDTNLKALADHVTSHMNTDLRRNNELAINNEAPVQLVYKYYRDSIAEISRVASSQANLKLVGDARVACEVSVVPITERLECVQTELAERSSDRFPVVEPLSKDFYVFDFASPAWSADIAGISLVVFGVSILLLLVRFIVGAIVARRLKRNIDTI